MGNPRHMNREQLERELAEERKKNAMLESKIEEVLAKIERLERALGYSERIMTY